MCIIEIFNHIFLYSIFCNAKFSYLRVLSALITNLKSEFNNFQIQYGFEMINHSKSSNITYIKILKSKVYYHIQNFTVYIKMRKI